MIINDKPHPIQTFYQPRGLIFKKHENSDKLQFNAQLNLRDALARTKMAASAEINMNDPAILALTQNMAQHQAERDSKKLVDSRLESRLTNSCRTMFSQDIRKVPPKNSRNSLNVLKDHRKGMFGNNGTTKSLPASPSLGGLTPQPTKRDAKALKQEALKVAFIHLLAVRAVSEKYMVSSLGCDVTDIKPLLEKYGTESPLDRTKFNLSNKGYKELDVWKFNYKDSSERQDAIERAIAAFDRQRISISDPLWQKLLPKDERNKGKVLSKLAGLHNGPVEKIRTPRIQIEGSAEEGQNNSDKQSEEEKRGRLAPGDGQARSRSQDQPTKKRITEREVQVKKLAGKDPKKVTEKVNDMAKTRSTISKEKKPSPKKATTKAAAPSSSKVKSAEFIHDSDEEIESDELATQPTKAVPPKRKAQDDISPANKKPHIKKTEPLPKPAPKPTPKLVPEKKPTPKSVRPVTKEDPVKKTQTELKKAISDTPESNGPTKKRIPEKQRPVPMARSLSHKLAGTSPVKPSPLGSSPPTNASDLENDQAHKAASSKSSSSSGSPLINQRRERLELEAKKSAANSLTKSKDGTPNDNVDRQLKRRVNDLDNDVHQHGVASVNGSSQASKRPRMPESPPSTSEESDKGASSNTSPSEILSPKDLDYARSFKIQAAKYESALRELQALSDPPPERVEKLQRMYQKLKAHKAEIWKISKGRLG
jgi:RNA polymerase II elongation factor ELL